MESSFMDTIAAKGNSNNRRDLLVFLFEIINLAKKIKIEGRVMNL